MVTDDELYNSDSHKVRLVDYLGRIRIANVILYEAPFDSEREYSGIGLDDNIMPNYLWQDNIESIEILD